MNFIFYEEAVYDSIVVGFEKRICDLFEKLDANKNGILEAEEIRDIVSSYNGDDVVFDEKQFMNWFDVARGESDGKIGLKEFRYIQSFLI